MNRAEFKAFLDQEHRAICNINDCKGHDYAGDVDAFKNFKSIAERVGVTPFQVWAVYALKHWDSVLTFVREGDVASEPIEGRLHDIILYSYLLLGMLEEIDMADLALP